MATPKRTSILEHLRCALIRKDGGELPDGELLEAFLAGRDEGAFEGLVRRHGPMVLGVCRRILGNSHDAEDAFQATFLVLMRKATSIIPREMVGNWLHGVAYTTAIRARTAAARRRAKERGLANMPARSEAREEVWQQLQPLLDSELQTLPDKYRLPIVLCDLEGKTRKQAARQLDWAEGTVASRLARGRALLAKRLRRHGLSLSGGALATAMCHGSASAAVPMSLVVSTIKAASLFAAGNAAAAAAGAGRITVLAEGVLRSMLLNKLKLLTMVLLAIAALAFGAGLLRHTLAAQQADVAVKPAAARAALPSPQAGPAKKTDAERFVGTWRLAKLTSGGEDAPAEFVLLSRWTFSKDAKITWTMMEETKKGSYHVVGPGKVDLNEMGDDKSLSPGIYAFDGDDKLTICFSASVKHGRPTEFRAPKDSSLALIVLTRAKPGEEKLTPEEMTKYKDAFNKMRGAAARALTANKLHQLGLAFHIYVDAFKAFPLHAIYSKDGKTPLLSWRVSILPYLGQEALYKEFKLDEAWDSPHNKKLIAKMPDLYQAGQGKVQDGLTHFQVFTGSDTMFDGTKKIQFPAITDGVSNTLLVIEAKDPVIWTKPADLTLPAEKGKMPAVGGLFEGSLIILFCDGSVHFVRRDIDAASLRALVTPSGGEAVDLKKLIVSEDKK